MEPISRALYVTLVELLWFREGRATLFYQLLPLTSPPIWGVPMTRAFHMQRSIGVTVGKRRKNPGPRRTMVTAVLVDGGFYRKRAHNLFGEKSPDQRADELMEYCRRHIREAGSNLYRVFYYDCPPSSKVVFHPLTRKSVNLSKSETYAWSQAFFTALGKKRKLALRWGEELETQSGYQLKSTALKKLMARRLELDDLSESDFVLDITQKGVDMKLGLDIASLAAQGIVNQIIMISGDSDFVPAAKHARREGIDFILDPMWANISGSLDMHIDGLTECVSRPPGNLKDPLHVTNTGEVTAAHGDSTIA